MRPVYHQTSERTKGHLFISVLAYHLLNSIETTLSNNNYNHKWSTIKKELETHQRSTIILTDEEGKIHHIRVSGVPESQHQKIYQILNIKDRLKRRHKIMGNRL